MNVDTDTQWAYWEGIKDFYKVWLCQPETAVVFVAVDRFVPDRDNHFGDFLSDHSVTFDIKYSFQLPRALFFTLSVTGENVAFRSECLSHPIMLQHPLLCRSLFFVLAHAQDKEGYLQGQIGNPDGEEKPNKKFYDPRVWIRKVCI